MVQDIPNLDQERRNVVPTLVIGVGGTGLEVIMRLRRMVVESYGSLQNLPILGFLHIDTDRNALLSESKARVAGPPLEDFEKLWAHVRKQDAETIANDSANYGWYHEWVPTELLEDPSLLASEEGAGRIRSCGRFAFFYNYNNIQQKCIEARQRIVGYDAIMAQKYGLQVLPKLNVFVVCSISGGTGSGMFIDLGYCLRRWFSGLDQDGLERTIVIPSPDAFSEIDASSDTRNQFQRNGYAALIELNCYSDRKEFNARYGQDEGTRIKDSDRPYDYIYFVGTSNGPKTLRLNAIREMLAQNIFLDLVSEFSYYKRSVRDNIKKVSAGVRDKPQEGRSFPVNFMSFGLATLEIPIHNIRNALSARLITDLLKWWRNSDVPLPAQYQKVIEDKLVEIKLLGDSLRLAILQATDRSYYDVVNFDLRNLQAQIDHEQWLQCTAKGPNFLAKEEGKVLRFLDSFFLPKIAQYISDHFRDTSPAKREHGDYLLKMYDNQRQVENTAPIVLESCIYEYLTDRFRGINFLQAMFPQMERIFDNQIQSFKSESTQWEKKKDEGWNQYNKSVSTIHEFQAKWIANKEQDIKKWCNEAFAGLQLYFQALLEIKSRAIACTVLETVKQKLPNLKEKTDRWQTRINSSIANFNDIADTETSRIGSIEPNEFQLFRREELNELYQDFIAKRQGLDTLCPDLGSQILERNSRLWEKSRKAESIFRLLDVEKIPDPQYIEFENILAEIGIKTIREAPDDSKLVADMDACIRLNKLIPEPQARKNLLRDVVTKSKPFVRLDTVIPPACGFNPNETGRVGIIGGESTEYPAALQQVTLLRQLEGIQISPLSIRERHKILSLHEVGQFSLRCINGIDNLRRTYLDWRGSRIQAERAKLAGSNVVLPSSIHIQHEFSGFWDFIPPQDRHIEQLVIIARALNVLLEAKNFNNKKTIVQYKKFDPILKRDNNIILAANWDEAVLILEVPSCGADKHEIENQVKQKIDAAKTPEQKEALRQTLLEYLENRGQEFENGRQNTQYKREEKLVSAFLEKMDLY